MLPIQRRKVLGGIAALGATTLAGTAGPAWAQAAPKGKLGPRLKIVIPGISRSPLDEAGRALGDALVGMGLTDEIDYENREGKGGTLGLAYYAEKYSADPNTFLMGDMTLVDALALQKPAVDLSRVQPVARLTTDYLVVVVAASSPVKTINDLAERLRSSPKQAVLGIGSMGGVDHVFAGLLNKAAGGKPEDLMCQPFARSFEMVDAVIGGKVLAGIAGYSPLKSELASGKLRALGVSSKRTTHGIKAIREQGLDLDLANWHAVFTGKNVAAARQAERVEAVTMATSYELWQKTVKQNYWEAAWLSGSGLTGFIDLDVKTAQVIVQLLKLKV